MKIVIYKTHTEKSPFSHWLNGLDRKARGIIRTRINRVILGNFGDSKRIKGGEGVFELRITYGPGYRIYFGIIKNRVIVLLLDCPFIGW